MWADEFSRSGRPAPASWDYETGFARNHEAQWYQLENAHCENGLLVIEARQENHPNPTYQAGSHDWRTSRPVIDYTSASLNTHGKHQWQYGRFEMRAHRPAGPGLWPAFWTLGVAQQRRNRHYGMASCLSQTKAPFSCQMTRGCLCAEQGSAQKKSAVDWLG